MGYLAQKKKFAREGVFLQVMLAVFCLFTLFAFLPEVFPALRGWMFQIYIINLLVFLYALFIRRFLFGLFFALLLVVNYFQVAASAQIFFNARVPAEHHISFDYAPDHPLRADAANAIILRRGHLVLGRKNIAPFLAMEKNGQVFTLIRVDLERNSSVERHIALNQLRNFISGQDDPVIVFGDFGEPVWMPEMERFLEDTSLEVKNRLLFTGRGSRHKYLSAPGFYVLSFQNTGIEELRVEAPVDKHSYPPVHIRLGFY